MNEAYIGFKDEDENPSAPLPTQTEASNLRGTKKCILNAGSFGTGKTTWLCVNVVNDAHEYPGNVILMGRKKLAWFVSSTLLDLLDAIPPELLLRHDKVNHNIYIKSKGKPSIISYRQLDTSRECLKMIKSMNLGMAAFDQIEELDETVVDAALGRLRRKNSARQLLGAANPLGRNWVWKRWIDGQGGPEYGFIEARMWNKGVDPPLCQADVTFATTDNPYLPWDYIKGLFMYPENWLNRYVFCEWDDFEGLVYPAYRDSIHGVEPFDIPDWWNRIIVLDHGHRNPTAIGWLATSPDGDLYLYDLHYVARKWVDHHAVMIKIKSEQNGTDLDDVLMWLADPSIFSKHTEVTIADEYAEEEIYWEPANNDVPGGINRCASYLRVDEDLKSPQYPHGKPKFFVFMTPETEPFREEIKEYTWMDMPTGRNDQEKPNKNKDHAMDMFRYAVNGIEDSEEPTKSKRPYPVKRVETSYMAI